MDDNTLVRLRQIFSKFPKHEFLGLKIKIIDSTDKTLISRQGLVIDETKNMLKIREDNKSEILLEKKKSVFEFAIEKKRIMAYVNAKQTDLELTQKEIHICIEGILLCGRPEERIKKKTRKNPADLNYMAGFLCRK
ncbi:MAG: ribonuclease P protein subunit [Candidatus Aenigmarchaeota archaeon]|nr:ribonuclease P protein subunit [Candidatus Aenigmarchaeota archaeon]